MGAPLNNENISTGHPSLNPSDETYLIHQSSKLHPGQEHRVKTFIRTELKERRKERLTRSNRAKRVDIIYAIHRQDVGRDVRAGELSNTDQEEHPKCWSAHRQGREVVK